MVAGVSGSEKGLLKSRGEIISSNLYIIDENREAWADFNIVFVKSLTSIDFGE